MEEFITIALGLIVGSFVNVVIARLPSRSSIVKPASHCPLCKNPIHWRDNVPILSFLLLRGRCRHCRTSISPRYPVVEALTAVLFMAAQARLGWGPELWIRAWPFMAALVAITFIDFEHRIIPDPLSLGGLAFGLLTCSLDSRMPWISAVLGAGLGFGTFYFFSWLYHRLTGRSGLGGGDVKLLAMLGAFLGPLGVFVTILISSVFGSLIGIFWAFFTRQKNVMRTAIPYGPFLVVGGLYFYLLGELAWLPFMIPT